MRVISEQHLARVLAGLPGRPRIVAGGNFATPRRALEIVDAALGEYRLFMLNAQGDLPDREGVALETPFVGAGMRGHANLRYFPSRLSLVPNLLKESLPPDVVVVQTSPPSAGTVSLGIEVNILPAAIEAVRTRGGLVIAQLNPHMPYTFGDAVLAEDEIDYAIEVDEPLATPAPRPPGEVAHQIGERVARLVPEHATLQADRNDRVRMLRTEKTNDPSLIARRPHMVSVNSALQVDLFAQANASRVHETIYSGFGGQTDFVVGALHSPGGHALPTSLPAKDCASKAANSASHSPDGITSRSPGPGRGCVRPRPLAEI